MDMASRNLTQKWLGSHPVERTLLADLEHGSYFKSRIDTLTTNDGESLTMNQDTMSEATLGGQFTFPGTSLTVRRMGYGAMQLAGPGVYGPPKDSEAAVAVLREAVAAGVNHIDTSDFYGPHITNQIIRQALHPYPAGLVIVTKLGARRPADKSWQRADSREELTAGVHDNLRNLGLEALDIVNYRAMGAIHGPAEGSIAEKVTVLADLKREGLIRHIGLSNVTAAQVAEAQGITEIVCVQNNYNVAHREDDALIDDLARQGIAYVPFFPLGGFTPLQSSTLAGVAARLGVTPMQLALAWLLHRSSNILLIPGTSSLAHLRENLAAAGLTLAPETLGELDGIASEAVAPEH
jgi:aryl-alcohol dehydrogenase-like predicted oxidoreductase